MPDPIAVVDRNAIVRVANPVAEESIGLKSGTCLHDFMRAAGADGCKVSGFLHLCLASTESLPTRFELTQGAPTVVYGSRLVLPGSTSDGLVLLRFDQRLEITSKFASLNDKLAAMTDKARHNHIQKNQLKDMVITDVLTGALNRRGFEQLLIREHKRARRYGRPLSLAVLDLDFFKAINDKHGHAVGDRVIRHFAELCGASLREQDSIARIGGEEFAVIMPETGLAAGEAVTERIVEATKSNVLSIDNIRLCYTVSAGVSELHAAEAIDDLVQRADANLYVAKDHGRARCISDNSRIN
ncbi:GGDEF domain-containing protein [Roseibium sp.]|uniref:GGDEF domain-containing protein n=1 Tax=Roseibium sp. TaxID=1936156 RepID=UPI003A96CAB7